MKCLVCLQKINPGESVFWGTQMMCSGHGDSDCEYSEAAEGIMGAVHLSCLESPSEVTRTPDAAACKSIDVGQFSPQEETIVERSDALSIFGL